MKKDLYKIYDAPEINLARGQVSFERSAEKAKGYLKVSTELTFQEDTELISFCDSIGLNTEKPEYVWTPCLCPEEGQVIGDHTFRSPAVILQENGDSFSLIPDLENLENIRNSPTAPAKMFMDLQKGKIKIGFADYECVPHVYYRLTGKPIHFAKGAKLKLSYYILSEKADSSNIRNTVKFLWKKFAQKHINSSMPQIFSFEEYAKMALESVEKNGNYSEFKISGGKTGAGFCACSSLAAKDLESSYFKAPLRAIWFHAWFNSFRTAFGIKYYSGKLKELSKWSHRADFIKDLILSSPDSGNGLIPALYDYENKEWWGGIPRLGGGRYIYDLTSSAQTAQWMLLWNRKLERDARLTARAEKLASLLIKLQGKNGAFPGYADASGAPLDLLKDSGHSGMSSLFLCEHYEDSKDKTALEAILKSCGFYIKEIIPESRFHDFETFFSCSEKALDFYDKRTGQHAQNNLCLYWITETLLRAYSFTKDKELLKWGLICLDRLSLYQQVWNPPYISLYTFGGFGVMNTDGEWNDTRQAFFSNTYFLAYKLTGDKEYLQRGEAALRAGCALLCHPKHKKINPLKYNAYPDGLAPENYAHAGTDGPVHRSGFDWGAGALMTMSAISADF